MEDRVASVFDRVAALLEEVQSTAPFSSHERGLLTHMLDQYLANTVPAHEHDAEECRDAGCEAHAPSRGADVHDNMAARSRLHKNLVRSRAVLREMVPYGSIAEKIMVPPFSPQFDPDVPAYDVDAFLFDDEDLDLLVEVGTVQRHYCAKCNSSEHVKTTQFLSHSFSMDQLVYLAEHVFPFVFSKWLASSTAAPNRSFRVADVGSRLGIVVATAAWSLTKPCRDAGVPLLCTGVELSKEYCAVQKRFFAKMTLREPNTTVVEGDATVPGSKANEAIVNADLVIMNNVFEWFMPFELQLETWKRVRASVSRAGQFLLVVPSLEDTLEPLFAHGAGSNDERPHKAHRSEGNAAKAAAAAFVNSWVERVDCSQLIQAFNDSRAIDGGDELESQGELEHLAELLGMMALYVVK